MSITVNLTAEEIATALLLMQLGVKSLAGEPFDNATSSYMHLRRKIIEATKAAALAAEAANAAANDTAAVVEAAE